MAPLAVVGTGMAAACGAGEGPPSVTAGGRGDAPSAPARVPAFGTTAWRANRLGRPDFALVRRSGARFYRFNATAPGRPGPRRARKYDRLVAAAAAEGVELLPVLLRGRPRRPGSARHVGDPPRGDKELREWRAQVRAYVGRYGPGGAFWDENPELPYRPLRVWEVWNEPNLRQFWEDREASPREYARLLWATRAAVRDADPRARVISAGLAWRYAGGRYLRALLEEAGGCVVDGIGIHPYARSAARAVRDLEEARAIADAHGARGVQLWSTEIGWKVGGHGYSAVRDEAAQEQATARFARAVARRRAELSLGPSFFFPLRDRVNPETGRVNQTGGLLRADGTPRPAFEAWSRAAHAAPPMSLPPARRCG